MIKVSVLYPKSEGTTFDMEYYRDTHMAIVDRTMKPAKWEIDAGTDGPYVAMGHLFFDSMDALGAAFGEAAESQADIPNFTNATPEIQISEVVA
jgi:uncharacterized protein (TIGR02118 family)